MFALVLLLPMMVAAIASFGVGATLVVISVRDVARFGRCSPPVLVLGLLLLAVPVVTAVLWRLPD